jgi:hypothetical protein
VAAAPAYCGKEAPEGRAAVARPGMNAHAASQPDTINPRPSAYLGGPNPERSTVPSSQAARDVAAGPAVQSARYQYGRQCAGLQAGGEGGRT